MSFLCCCIVGAIKRHDAFSSSTKWFVAHPIYFHVTIFRSDIIADLDMPFKRPTLSYHEWRQTAFAKNRKVLVEVRLRYASHTLLPNTLQNAGGPRLRMRLFGESLLEKTAKRFSTWFSHETVRIDTLVDPCFAFLETIFSNSDGWSVCHKTEDKNSSFSSSPMQRNPFNFVFSFSEKDSADEGSSQKRNECEGKPRFWEQLFASEEPENKETSSEDEILVRYPSPSPSTLFLIRSGKVFPTLQLEIRRYCVRIKKSRPDVNENPYRWRQNNSGEFPRLKKLQSILCRPSQSTASAYSGAFLNLILSIYYCYLLLPFSAL